VSTTVGGPSSRADFDLPAGENPVSKSIAQRKYHDRPSKPRLSR